MRMMVTAYHVDSHSIMTKMMMTKMVIEMVMTMILMTTYLLSAQDSVKTRAVENLSRGRVQLRGFHLEVGLYKRIVTSYIGWYRIEKYYPGKPTFAQHMIDHKD